MQATDTEGDGAILSRLRQQFQSYASAKDREIDEWRMAHRYYAGRQMTEAELRVYRQRKQPAIIFNRIQRKIDGIVGTIRRMRGDPKAFPVRPEFGPQADLATHAVRYICDASDFEGIEADATWSASIFGMGGLEMGLRPTPEGDREVELIPVDSRAFFYDPRSFKADFSDARYMGTYKWVTPDEIDEIAPGMGERLKGEADGGFTTQADTDRDDKWTDEKGRIRLVDHWYIAGGKWRWCLHVGTVKIAGGDSPFFDEKGKSLCKYRMWSAFIDDEGDRYGFIRLMKGPQDAINQHRSKAMHIMNTRQVLYRNGVINDPVKFRIEAAKPDGMMEYDGNREDVEIIQPAQEFLQQTQYFQDAKDEIENFGPNQALLGTNMSAKSGRALRIMQESGLAELGPFLKNYRMWKLDVYRAIWANTKRYTTAERMWRITGDREAAEFIAINQTQLDPFGMPVIVNRLAAIDVEIRIEEGPDTETVMGDTFDALQAIAQNGMPVPPQVIVEMAGLPSDTKAKILEMLEPKPDPMKQQADAAMLQQEIDKALKLQAETFKTTMDGMLKQQELMMGRMAPMPVAPPPVDQAPVASAPQGIDMSPALELLAQSQAQSGQMIAGALQGMAMTNETLAGAIMQQGQMQNQGMAQLSSAMMAPIQNELIRDPETGRTVGSRSFRMTEGAV